MVEAVNPVPRQDAFIDVIAALGAFAYLEAFAKHFPNTEKMLESIDAGEKIIIELAGGM